GPHLADGLVLLPRGQAAQFCQDVVRRLEVAGAGEQPFPVAGQRRHRDVPAEAAAPLDLVRGHPRRGPAGHRPTGHPGRVGLVLPRRLRVVPLLCMGVGPALDDAAHLVGHLVVEVRSVFGVPAFHELRATRVRPGQNACTSRAAIGPRRFGVREWISRPAGARGVVPVHRAAGGGVLWQGLASSAGTPRKTRRWPTSARPNATAGSPTPRRPRASGPRPPTGPRPRSAGQPTNAGSPTGTAWSTRTGTSEQAPRTWTPCRTRPSRPPGPRSTGARGRASSPRSR